jgi:hypothetical protein
MLVRDYAMPVTGLPVQVVPTGVWFARLERVALGKCRVAFLREFSQARSGNSRKRFSPH